MLELSGIWDIIVINQPEEIGEKQLSDFGCRGGQSPLMHVPLCLPHFLIANLSAMLLEENLFNCIYFS